MYHYETQQHRQKSAKATSHLSLDNLRQKLIRNVIFHKQLYPKESQFTHHKDGEYKRYSACFINRKFVLITTQLIIFSDSDAFGVFLSPIIKRRDLRGLEVNEGLRKRSFSQLGNQNQHITFIGFCSKEGNPWDLKSIYQTSRNQTILHHSVEDRETAIQYKCKRFYFQLISTNQLAQLDFVNLLSDLS